MELIDVKSTEQYKEIEIRKRFLWWSWTVKYRKYGGHILRFEEPNRFYNTGMMEHCEIEPLFKCKL